MAIRDSELKSNGKSPAAETDETTPFTQNEAKPDPLEIQDGGSVAEEGKDPGFCTKLTTNKTYRNDFILTLNLISSFFMLVNIVHKYKKSLIMQGQ